MACASTFTSGRGPDARGNESDGRRDIRASAPAVEREPAPAGGDDVIEPVVDRDRRRRSAARRCDRRRARDG
jgi:hypothetical protein